MSRKKLLVLAGFAAFLTAVVWLSTPPALVNAAIKPDLPADIDAFLAAGEKRVNEQFSLVPDTEKRVLWLQAGVRTEYAVVYLHGFSATRQETAPLAEQVARSLQANLFETRLTGHGHAELPMHDVRAEDWLEDAAEALAVGARLGDKIVLIGTSTGGTLALAMSDHEAARSVSDLVLISPNIEPRDATAKWATRPGGLLLARLVAGETRSWTPHNDLQARYWSTSYPTVAAIEVMRLVALIQSRLPLDVQQNLLVLLSPEDKVVSPAATQAAFANIRARRKQLVEVTGSLDPSNHVLAGDILAPETTPDIAATIVNFITGAGNPEL
jgi:esterase/lipase